MKYRVTNFLVLIILYVASINTASAKNVALVIGNYSYPNEEELVEVKNDANSMFIALSALGYEMVGGKPLMNANSDIMLEEVRKFISNINNGDTAIFYYSGHGKEDLGENIIIGTDLDAGVAVETDLLDEMAIETDGYKIVILDTCRSPGGDTDLKRPRAIPSNSMIVYASPPGRSVSYPSAFTKSFVSYIQTPGLEVKELLNKTRTKTLSKTNGSQRSIEYGSLNGNFYFRDRAYIDAVIHNADDDAKIIVNGDVQLNWRGEGSAKKRIYLNPGENKFEFRIHNWRSFTGGIEGFGGHKPEGWRYEISLFASDGNLIKTYTDGEHLPKKDGPTHGAEFSALKGSLNVDPKSGKVSIGMVNPYVWKD